MDILNIALIAIAAAAILTAAAAYAIQNSNFSFTRKAFVKTNKPKNAANDLTDYGTYNMKPLELAAAVILSAAVLFLIGYIFYRSIIFALLLTPIALFYPRLRTRQIIKKRKKELKQQFIDALQSLSSSLHAGRSVESAMKSAIEDLMIQYEADDYIVREFEIIARKLESNETIEKAFEEFANRSKLDEIQDFAEVLEICKRTGGNLITAIKSSTEIISDKNEVLNSIDSMLAEKKLEQNILSIMPIAIILMLSFSSKDFMQPVFTQAVGKVVMTISLALFALAHFIAEKITDIEV